MSAHSVYKDIISEQHLKVITNEFHRLKGKNLSSHLFNEDLNGNTLHVISYAIFAFRKIVL